MPTMGRFIRVCCKNTAENVKLLVIMGYRDNTAIDTRPQQHLRLNIWTLEFHAQHRLDSLLLSTEDLAAMVLMPSIDVIEQYIYMLQDEALAKFGAALKSC